MSLTTNWHKTVTRPGKNETLSTLQKQKSWFSAVMLWGNPKEKISYNHQNSPPKTRELRSCWRYWWLVFATSCWHALTWFGTSLTANCRSCAKQCCTKKNPSHKWSTVGNAFEISPKTVRVDGCHREWAQIGQTKHHYSRYAEEKKYEKMPFRLRCIQKMAVWNEKTSFSFEV